MTTDGPILTDDTPLQAMGRRRRARRKADVLPTLIRQVFLQENQGSGAIKSRDDRTYRAQASVFVYDAARVNAARGLHLGLSEPFQDAHRSALADRQSRRSDEGLF